MGSRLRKRNDDEEGMMPADLQQTIKGLMPRLTDELKKLVRLPSVAFPDFPTAPVEQTGAAVAQLLTEAGLPNVRMVDVPRAPQAVFGERPAQPGAPTVLLYAHYDVQPAGPEEACGTASRSSRRSATAGSTGAAPPTTRAASSCTPARSSPSATTARWASRSSSRARKRPAKAASRSS